MALKGLEGTLMCSMVEQNDHEAHFETFLAPHWPDLSNPARDARFYANFLALRQTL
jgi:hypothetical protein